MSCAAQLTACRQYALSMGWTIVGEWRDEAVSGTLGRTCRAGWDDLITATENGTIPRGAVVLVWDIDRWSRDWTTGMTEALGLHQRGIGLADTASGLIDQETLGGQLMLALKLGGSAEYSVKLSRRSKNGLAEARAAGKWTCPAPFGYRRVPGEARGLIEPDPVEAPIYREIVKRALALETAASICRDLNRRGVKTKRDRHWTPATVKGLLLNPAYLGELPIYDSRSGGKTVNRMTGYSRLVTLPGKHLALIDRLTWLKARDLVMPRTPRSRATAADRPLSGLVVCEVCGRRCYVVGYPPYMRYRCRPYGMELCKSLRTVGIAQLEAAVRGWARTIAKDERAVRDAASEIQREELERARQAAAARGPIEAQVREIEQRLERLMQALYCGQAPALLVKRMHQEEAALAECKAKLAALGDAVTPMPLDRVVAWIMDGLRAGARDLKRLRPLIEGVDLPEDPEGAPVLRALGQRWVLLIPVRKRARRPAAKGRK